MKSRLKTREMMFIALFSALTSVSSYIIVPLPFSPVPITAQTLIVMLAGSTLTPRSAFLSMLVFLFLGICGLPVFSGGQSGIGALLGPTGGYILSWPIATFIMAFLLERLKPNFRSMLFVNIIGGIIIIYTIGVLYLSLIAGIGLLQAFTIGALPFIPGDLAKVVLSSTIALSLRKTVFYK